MNFGDILEKWDEQQLTAARSEKNLAKQQKSHKKANAPTAEEKAAHSQGYRYDRMMQEQSGQKINPMELWLRRYGTIDKDAAADEYEERRKMGNRAYLKELYPEARLDLHGMTREEAEEKLSQFITECSKKGYHKILLIHGKGNHSTGSDPVLGDAVRSFIEHDKRLGTSGHPDRRHGGTGATWVIIKQ
ncbi:MAG: Smr/MutS family protein [Treponema sp.]|jgi:DNA-nicking Smr family endonuclease|nr:Smr/MutS family protein [Treponema sp.]